MIENSSFKLHSLENQYVESANNRSATPQATLFSNSRPEEQAAISRLKSIATDQISPREALDILYELNKLLK